MECSKIIRCSFLTLRLGDLAGDISGFGEELSRAKTQRRQGFGVIGKNLSLRAWRPFDGVYPELSRRTQDMLGAINILTLVLFNNTRVRT